MKLVAIDSTDSSIERGVAFRTEPPLASEVFQEFCTIWRQFYFSYHGDLLIWHGHGKLTPAFLKKTEEQLTEAEKRVEQARRNRKRQQAALIERASKETGLPLS